MKIVSPTPDQDPKPPHHPEQSQEPTMAPQTEFSPHPKEQKEPEVTSEDPIQDQPDLTAKTQPAPQTATQPVAASDQPASEPQAEDQTEQQSERQIEEPASDLSNTPEQASATSNEQPAPPVSPTASLASAPIPAQKPLSPAKKKLIIAACIAAGVLILSMIIYLLAAVTCTFGHVMEDATCTKPALCQKCGHVEGEACGHSWDGETTCEKIAECTICGAKKDSETLPHEKTNIKHEKPATCKEKGRDVFTCKTCGKTFQEVLPLLDHKYPAKPTRHDEFYVTVDTATLYPGHDVYVCEVCGNEKAIETDENITNEQKRCIEQGISYLGSSSFSKQDLVDQLEYEGYNSNMAKWAVDHLKVNWNEQAYQEAKSYLRSSNFSYNGLMRQLTSTSGSGFTQSEAEYAMAKIDKETDWNEQAYQEAKSYLRSSSFSKSRLIQQLESSHGSGFTHEQAVYGANKAYDE